MITISYILVATAANLAWEMLQLPLYTIWRTARGGELAYAAIHCTIGDFVILAAALLLSLLLVGDAAWPSASYARVGIVATGLGVGYTVFSEWLNLEVTRRWAYLPDMPVLPPFGTGLSPFLQWALIPPFALAATWRMWARRTRPCAP
jgi:hypothetical protein